MGCGARRFLAVMVGDSSGVGFTDGHALNASFQTSNWAFYGYMPSPDVCGHLSFIRRPNDYFGKGLFPFRRSLGFGRTFNAGSLYFYPVLGPETNSAP